MKKIKFSHKIVAVLVLLLAVVWVCYGLFGYKFIEMVYEGRSIALLNNMVTGQDLHSVDHYYSAAGRLLKKLTLGLFVVCAIVIIFGFLKGSHQALAVMFGFVLLFIMIIITEVFLHVVPLSKIGYEREYSHNYHDLDQFGIVKPYTGTHTSSFQNKKTGHVVFDVEYHIDDFRKRVTEVKNRNKRNKFILFLGGSFTYGEGVHGHETMPYYVGQLTQKTMPYNYGFHGQGPFDVLAKLDNINFHNEIAEKEGVGIYTFIDRHMHRLAGSMSIISWKGKHPFYRETAQGSLKRDGSFLSARPFLTRFYRLLKWSKILGMLRVDFPMRFDEEHIKLLALTAKEMQMSFQKKYPNNEFYILIYPGSIYGKQLLKYLDQKDVLYLDYSELFDPEDPQHYLAKEDKHPTALAYQKLAEQIVIDLNLE